MLQYPDINGISRAHTCDTSRIAGIGGDVMTLTLGWEHHGHCVDFYVDVSKRHSALRWNKLQHERHERQQWIL